eukprot:TRINITY_DN2744_c0_g1_i1.p1 TRINITY_DN2744_c0_g1~~TRINITY_DN2744_c0_g1_i1.p1  ORF type:complete len:207 (-),score=48.59 TRINITY_DN2744_c0_g1_i1:89-709(-)
MQHKTAEDIISHLRTLIELSSDEYYSQRGVVNLPTKRRRINDHVFAERTYQDSEVGYGEMPTKEKDSVGLPLYPVPTSTQISEIWEDSNEKQKRDDGGGKKRGLPLFPLHPQHEEEASSDEDFVIEPRTPFSDLTLPFESHHCPAVEEEIDFSMPFAHKPRSNRGESNVNRVILKSMIGHPIRALRPTKTNRVVNSIPGLSQIELD